MNMRALAAPASARASLKDRAKLSLGSVIFPAQTRRWRDFLSQHPMLDALTGVYPRILHKIYRPYLSRDLNCADRVDVLIDHYGIIFKAGLGNLVVEAAHHPVEVAAFTGKSGATFQIRLSAINVGHREGEMSLQLIANHVCVYSVTFVLMRVHGEAYIKVGCLQGLRSHDGALQIKTITRELHGCRPKTLLVALVRGIGAFLACKGLLLISNQNRISINHWRRRKITSNYDVCWEEMRARRRHDGNFELPCTGIIQASFEAIPSHKRSEARKRSALIGATLASTETRLREFAA